MADNATVRVEDVMPVRSRVSWGAIFAGAMVALALYFLLILLGAALGLSVSDRVGMQDIRGPAALWAIVATLLALFVGGLVTSQCTVGENKIEAIMYGIILWGVLFGMLLWLGAVGARSGFHAMVGLTNTPTESWEAAARRAGVPQESIDEWRRRAAGAPEAARDPQTQQALADAATRVTWWAFLGTLLSMIAAVAGAYVGAGPTLRLLPAGVSQRFERHEHVVRS